jgi:hypothetical protein
MFFRRFVGDLMLPSDSSELATDPLAPEDPNVKLGGSGVRALRLLSEVGVRSGASANEIATT